MERHSFKQLLIPLTLSGLEFNVYMWLPFQNSQLKDSGLCLNPSLLTGEVTNSFATISFSDAIDSAVLPFLRTSSSIFPKVSFKMLPHKLFILWFLFFQIRSAYIFALSSIGWGTLVGRLYLFTTYALHYFNDLT